MKLIDRIESSEKANRYISHFSFLAAGANVRNIILGVQAESVGTTVAGASLLVLLFLAGTAANERAIKIRQVDDYLEGYKRGLSAR